MTKNIKLDPNWDDLISQLMAEFEPLSARDISGRLLAEGIVTNKSFDAFQEMIALASQDEMLRPLALAPCTNDNQHLQQLPPQLADAQTAADESARITVEVMFMAWASGNIAAMMDQFSEDVIFAEHPAKHSSLFGQGLGKQIFAGRLQRNIDAFHLIGYDLAHIDGNFESLHCRAKYTFIHKASAMTIDGRMRFLCLVRDKKIRRLEMIHDAQRMEAFLRLAENRAKVDIT